MFTRLFPILHETPAEPSGAAPAEAAPPVPEPVVTPPANDAPWANDIAFITDDAQRAQVDEYLRTKVQPRVTKLEQDLAELRPAQELYDDLIADRDGTLTAVVEQLYDPEVAEQIKAALTPPAEQTPAQERQVAEMDPRLKAVVEDYEERTARERYEAELARVKQANPDVDLELFHPFVIASDDMDSAVAAYNKWVATATEKLGPPAVKEDPPATVEANGSGATPPPTETRYETLDAAIDAAIAESRKSPPPAVGQV